MSDPRGPDALGMSAEERARALRRTPCPHAISLFCCSECAAAEILELEEAIIETLPRYVEMFVALGLGDPENSVAVQIMRKALVGRAALVAYRASAPGGSHE